MQVNGEIKNLTSENSSIPAEKKNYYLWTVKALDKTSADEKTKYTFTNAATGDILSFDLEEGQFIYGEGADDLKKAAYIFSFGTKSGATVQDAEYNYTTKAEDITQQLYTIADVKTPGDAVGTRLALNIQDTRLVDTESSDLDMRLLEDASVAASTLNKWYNGKGFNLAANGENVLDNLFGGKLAFGRLTFPKW